MASLSLRPALRARNAASATRTFTTTSATCQNIVPPQSPSYIRMPPTPQDQQSEDKKKRVRGVLPVPRDVFPRREGDRKLQPSYLHQTVPRPKPENDYDGSKPNPSRAWKKQMADQRRENLESGLQSLYARRQTNEARRQKRIAANFEANRRAVKAPEREDDRLTRSTVLDAMLDTAVKPDPDRFRKFQQARERVRKAGEQRRQAREDALMELYISSGDFILHESELKAEIERVFADDYFHKMAVGYTGYTGANNVWGKEGAPTSLQSMVAVATDSSMKPGHQKSEHEKTARKMQRIAEEFTGGKMDVPGQ